MKDWLLRVLFAIWCLGASAGLILACGGCQPSAVRQKVTTIANRGTVNDALGESDPLRHPIKAITAYVKKFEKPLITLTVIAVVALGVGIGLYFTPLSWISTILVPVAGSVAAVSFTGLVSLPVFPWFALGLIALGVSLVIYELYYTKSLPGAITALKSLFGFKSTPTTVQLTHT